MSFNICKGTEQGHPLSPELFKVYFKELSDFLNKADTCNPVLSDIRITHLAWADDVVIMALDRSSLDKQLRIIEEYCKKWGLEINISKTKFMIMNSRITRSHPIPGSCPSINNRELERVSSYCYLGIIISSNGKLSDAVNSLSQKGLGAMFSLRNTIDRRFIDPRNLNSLFTMLIKPIITYGCQIWLPCSPLARSLAAFSPSQLLQDHKLLSLIAKQPYEKVLLRHLKYLLGINRRSCNAAAWGETGQYPLITNCVSQCIRYFKRIITLDDECFVKAAIKEQISMSLSWFSGIKGFVESFDNINRSDYEQNTSSFLNALLMANACSPIDITTNIKKAFADSWANQLQSSTKLSFYNSIKTEFSWEPYLDSDCVPDFKERRSTAQIRSSAHKLNIETGRYNNTPHQDRLCDFCTSLVSSHSSPNPIAVESEDHFINECPHGSTIRSSFINRLHSLIPNLSVEASSRALVFSGTFPSFLQEFFDSSDALLLSKAKKDFIRISCRHLHKMYLQTLQLKKDLQTPAPLG
jgi:hypothetical protein